MKIAIIGGGAAGLMAAATLIESVPKAEIFLIERNVGLGKKVIISGGGRCNVTTGIQDVRTVLTKYPRGNKFLSSAIFGFPPEAVFAWFESHGVPLKTENDLRVFPESNQGKDIVDVFERLFTDPRVHVMEGSAVTNIEKDEDGFIIHLENRESLRANVVILTTGGQAYRHTGSTGDGYAFASALGHTITPLAPSLNSFTVRETWPADLSGLSFEDANISTERGKGYSHTGPFLFTHRGVSGPAVFALSSLVAFEQYDEKMPLEISIDLFPKKSLVSFTEQLVAKAAEFPKKRLTNVLAMSVPKSLAESVILQLGFDGDMKAAEASKKDHMRIAERLKNIPLEVIGRGTGDEFVTAGGVELAEINPSTMESKITPGLFFGGEIMNIDGFTGGFNLQASWATGRLAGLSIAEKLLR